MTDYRRCPSCGSDKCGGCDSPLIISRWGLMAIALLIQWLITVALFIERISDRIGG
jgi:hypothetical protein